MIRDRYGNKITKEVVIDALQLVIDGADVYDRRIAMILRAIQNTEETNEFVDIIPLGELSEITGINYDGKGQLPYFGAITSAEGRKWLSDQQ